MIIGLYGASGVGKTSLAEVLCEDFGYSHIRFQSIIESMLYEMNPIVHSDLMIEGGIGIMRLRSVVDSMGWTKAKSEYEEITELLNHTNKAAEQIIGIPSLILTSLRNYKPSDRYIVTDLSQPEHFQAIADRNGLTVCVTRPGTTELDTNQSFDMTLTNDGSLEQWQDQAVALVKDAADFVTKRATEVSPTLKSSSHYGMR
jgi:dephospho-CoA kinase